MDCSKVFLQDSSPSAFTLLLSSPWLSSLFPVDVLSAMTQSPVVQGLSQFEHLGWTESRDALLTREWKLIDPSLPGLLPGTSGGRHHPSTPSSRFSYVRHPSTSSSGRDTKCRRYDPTSRFRQEKGKPPFRGSGGSRGASSRGSAPQSTSAMTLRWGSASFGSVASGVLPTSTMRYQKGRHGRGFGLPLLPSCSTNGFAP